jgi:transposase
MAKRIGPTKIKQYSLEFKLKAVQLSDQPGVLIKDVAESLCIHPFMLSRWRKQVRDGDLAGDLPPLEPQEAAELRRLREVEQQFRRLQMEHESTTSTEAYSMNSRINATTSFAWLANGVIAQPR